MNIFDTLGSSLKQGASSALGAARGAAPGLGRVALMAGASALPGGAILVPLTTNLLAGGTQATVKELSQVVTSAGRVVAGRFFDPEALARAITSAMQGHLALR